MFMQRLITSLILIPLVLFLIFFAPLSFLIGFVVLVILAATSECWKLIPINHKAGQLIFLLLMLGCFWICGTVFNFWLDLGLVFWLFIILAIVTFPDSQHYWGYPYVVGGACLLLIPLFGQCLIYLVELPLGKWLLVYLLFLVWSADIGAYLAGKQWGKHKLIPQVSPGKSWEGALGGLILVLIVATVGCFYFHPISFGKWYLLALVIAVISVFGDLYVSILKRRCHLKDTGTLIPGHGGILDRLDSLIAALPFFCLGSRYILLT